MWDHLSELLQQEFIQRQEEGCDASGMQERIRAAADSGDEARMQFAYDELMALPIRADFPYIEPSDWEGIQQERPQPLATAQHQLTESEWADKFLGAWLGRCAGCALGKPLETRDFMSEAAGNPGWKNVALWFQGAGDWPITGYTPGHSAAETDPGLRLSPWCARSQREQIAFMESDDDIRYTVLGLTLLEEKGLAFDSWDMGRHWQRYLSLGQVFTAERRAYLNLALALPPDDTQKPADWQRRVEWIRTYRNPYREWIGAQIRADGLAYAAAGDPDLAAELAWRDASLSHVKNGIYGEMFAAGMIAAAFLEDDIERIVAAGLSQIPRHSRLAEDITEAVTIARQSQSQLELVESLWEAFGHYHPAHTNNNATLVAATLIYAQGNFETAITTAVLGGWDTDCNGATVGSVMGAKLGAADLPPRWTQPLHDTLYADIPGFHPIPISECARRSQAVFDRVRREGIWNQK